MNEVHIWLASPPQSRARLMFLDLISWIWVGLHENGIRVSVGDTEYREGVCNIVFEAPNPPLLKFLESAGRPRLNLVAFVTEIIDGDKFDDSSGAWDGRSRYSDLIKLAQHCRGILTSVESNVPLLRGLAPTSFFDFGYSDILLPKNDLDVKHRYSFTGALTPHRREQLAKIGPGVFIPSGHPGHTAHALRSEDAYLNLFGETLINIGLKQHREWPLPSPTKIGRILHAARGSAIERTSVTTKLSQFITTFEDPEDFHRLFSELDPMTVLVAAHSQRDQYRVQMPQRREAERNLAECPALTA